ncbi:MAG: AsmA family protein [Nitrosospira sp.]|nr:AsmA family protein [Nitrosospira sp.]
MSIRSSIRAITRSRTILSITGILLVAIVVFVIWFDWNMMKPYIERQVTERTGREFVIQGDLDVDLSLNPLISVEGVSLANADWGTEQPMLGVDRAAFRISLWDLILGDIVLPEVSISQPKIILEKSADGKRNWDLKKDEEKEAELPEIGRLTLDQGMLIYRDPKTETDVTVNVFTDPAMEDAREMPLNVAAEGKVSGLKFIAEALGGKVLSLADKTAPYPVKGSAEIGTTRAEVDGTITGLASMDMKMEIRGEDLSTLYPIAGIVIFPSPPYQISGRLRRQDTEWSLKGFAGQVGKSDLGGDVVFDTGGDRPTLRADVVSQVLDLTDLSGFMGARRAPQPEDSPAEKQEKKVSIEAQRHRVLPDQEFRVDRLRAMDADVKFTGKSIRNEDLPVDHLVAHLKIDNGLLTLDPLNFAAAGGNIVITAMINGRKDIPAAEVSVDVKRLQLPKLLPKVEMMEDSKGLIGGTTSLKGHGDTVGKLLASAEGRFGLIMSGGQISNLMLEIIGLDAGEILKFLAIGDENAGINCAVTDFDISKGMMSSETFVIATTDTNIVGEGTISLVEETIDMKISPKPKDLSVLALRTPFHIGGTFKDPTVLPDKTLAARVGAAVLLGVFATPLAALIPLIETAPGEEHDCKALIASAKQAAQEAKTKGQKD